MLLKVLISIALAILAGWYTGPTMEIAGVPFLKIYALIGQLFLNALTLVVVPLVASSIITGTAKIGSDNAFASLGLKTFGYFILNSLLAILLGVFLVTLINPGIYQQKVNIESLVSTETLAAIEAQGSGDTFDKFAQIFLKIIPSNILAVASQGQMLGLIFFTLLFGYFITKIESQPASIVLGFWKGVFQIMMSITHLVMKALPIGVFGLVAKVIAAMGIDSIRSVGYFSVTIVLGLFIHMFVVWPLLLKFVGRVNPFTHFKAVAPALLTAFSTSSSAAALPITIDCVEKRAGVSNRVSSFTLPLGASLKMAGTALSTAVTVFFIAQWYGVELGIASQVIVILMALLTSTGMAGIPSASLVSITLILQTIGLPADAIGLVLAVERLLDMCRTTVNVFGNTCCAVLVARSEGEKNVLAQVPVYE
jgi:proton glutamate symport protein